MGYEPAGFVETGEDAVEQAAALQPDLVLMDIRLSGTLDGIEAAKQIAEKLQIPVIFVTGRADYNTRKRAERIRPVEYLIKPVEMNILQDVIEKTFSRVA